MCIQVTKTANRFEISSLLEKIIETSQVVLNFSRTVYIDFHWINPPYKGPSWSLSCSSWIYNYLCLSPIVSSNPVHSEVDSIQHYVLKFVSDLRQVGGFLWALRFPPPIKLTATI
jgi:hypothetical protein